MKPRKEPIRMCTGCRTGKAKKDLVRVVKGPDGEISVDLTGKKSGRGAYICKNESCLSAARKAKCFERAFECKISDEIYERLLCEIKGSDNEE
ncbi:MAG: YlxR family protein [Oscillospiraceae bacterium]